MAKKHIDGFFTESQLYRIDLNCVLVREKEFRFEIRKNSSETLQELSLNVTSNIVTPIDLSSHCKNLEATGARVLKTDSIRANTSNLELFIFSVVPV